MAVVERTKVYILGYAGKFAKDAEKYKFLFEVCTEKGTVNIKYFVNDIENSCSMTMFNGTVYRFPKTYSINDARIIWKELIQWKYFHENP